MDRFFSSFALQGPLCFPENALGGLVATRPSPGNRVYIRFWSGLGLDNMAAQGPSPTCPSSNTSASSVSPSGPSDTVSKSHLESKASSLNPVPRSTCCEDSLPLAVFYGPLDAKNPLLATCEKEIQELLGFMKRKKALVTAEEQKHEFRRRW